MAFVDTLMMPQIDPRSVNGGPSMHLNSRCIFLKHIRDIDPCILSMAEYLEDRTLYGELEYFHLFEAANEGGWLGHYCL